MQFLKSVIGGARVVQFGDQTHGDGATIWARSRLVRFLHQQMRFDVLVWESGFFDCEQMNEALTGSGQLLPLFRYVRSTFGTARPLHQTGLDMQDFLGDPRDPGASLRRLFGRIDDLDPELASTAERQAIEAVVDGALRNKKATPAERDSRRGAVTQILSRMKSRSGESRSVVMLERALGNVLTLEEYSSYDQSPTPTEPPLRKLYRDRKMGETLLWILNRYHAGRKLIVLIGGGHAAHNIGALYAHAEKSSYTGYRTAGDVIHEALGPGVYTVQFAAYEGTFGPPFRPPGPLGRPSSGSLEEAWHRTGLPYAFLDLRSLPVEHWLRAPVLARPFGYIEQEAVWPRHFDAFLYTDLTFPSTQDGSVPAAARPASQETVD